MKTIRQVATVSLFALIPCAVFGQSEVASSAFEAASVTPTKSAARKGVRAGGENLTGTKLTLKELLAFAHDLNSNQISGPDWIETEGYDITAEAKGPATYPQHRQMLQALLEDRFQLTSHRETSELPVYWLVVADGGPKLGGVKEQQSFEEAVAGKSPFRPGMSGVYTYKDLFRK